LQSTDERECRDIFIAVKNLDELVLKVADVRLEGVALSHFDDEVVVIFLGGSQRSPQNIWRPSGQTESFACTTFLAPL